MHKPLRLIAWRSLVLTAMTVAAGCLVSAATAADKTATPKAGGPDPAVLTQRIDREVQQRLDAEKLPPSPLADDAEFLRRAYLDILGVIPTPEKAAAFLDSTDPSKRAKLIDELLASPEYGKHMADTWVDLLLPHNSDNRRLQTGPLFTWLEGKFNSDLGWDKLVYELVTASGPQDQNGAVTYFLANPTADKVTDSVGKYFLGVQLQCAQCHNHPFTKWKQAEYWGMAMFFTKVRGDRVNKAAKDNTVPGVTEGPKANPKGLPESAKMVAPKFLLAEQPKIDEKEPYRPVVAKWMTSPDNRFFAKAMVNRMWSQFFGRGFVNPIDDMHDANPASHPELLKEMTQQFVSSNYDLKFLIRAICNSQAYQRTSKPTAGNEDDALLFSHMSIKPMSPEQLYDSLTMVSNGIVTDAAERKAKIAKKGGPGDPRSNFTTFFRTEEGADPTEYQAGIPQVLRLMNSQQTNRNMALLERAVKAGQPAQVIEKLFLGTLSRRPTGAESERFTNYVKMHDAKAYNDVLWVLLNSSEFALNH